MNEAEASKRMQVLKDKVANKSMSTQKRIQELQNMFIKSKINEVSALDYAINQVEGESYRNFEKLLLEAFVYE